ncbi:MAG: PAS domain S-box protein [Bacteroidota bacterium]
MRIAQVYGVSSHIQAIEKLMGIDPYKFEVVVPSYKQSDLDLMKNQKLSLFPEGLHALSGRRFPKQVTKSIEKLLGIKTVFAIGFTWNDRLYGGIVILSKTGNEPDKMNLIETLANLTAMALQRKFAENNLIKNENLYRSLIETSPDGISMSDLEGNIIKVNGKCLEMFKMSSIEEVLGKSKNLLDFISAKDKPRALENYRKRTEGQAFNNEVYEGFREDGSVFPFEVNSSLLIDAAEKPYAVISVLRDVSERIKRENEIRKSEERFSKAFNTSNVIMAISDVDSGMYINVNDAFCSILGFSHDEVIGNTAKGLGIIRDFSSRKKLLGLIGKTGNLQNVELEVYTKAGEKHWGLFTAETIELEGKNYLLSTMTDITDRKKAEEDLEKNQAALIEAQHISKVGSWEYDIANDKPTWSKQMFRIFRIDDRKGEPGWEMHKKSIHPDDWEMLDIAVKKCIQDGTPYDIEFRIPGDKFSVYWARTIGSAIKDKTGKVVKLNGTVQDITDQKTADEKLLISEKRFRDLFDNASDLIYTLDLEGNFTSFNKTAENVVGFNLKPDEKMPNIREFLDDDEFRNAMSKIMYKLENGIPNTQYDARLNTRKGTTLDLEINSYLHFKEGKPFEIFGIARDISERKQRELQQKLSVRVLDILNEDKPLKQVLGNVINILKKETRCDATAVRIKEGDDFPYFIQDGFSEDFLLTENNLSALNDGGSLCRDENGNPMLECACGLVCMGKTDPQNSLFTKGGSFWTNDSPQLLDMPEEQEPRIRPRNRCIHDKYMSVALIPIRSHHKIIGMIQMNSYAKGFFTLEIIQFLEGLASSIGIAINRKLAETDLLESQSRLDLALKSARMGVWHWDIIKDKRFFDKEVCKLLGLDSKKFNGSADEFFKCIHHDDVEKVKSALKTALEKNKTYEPEYRVVWPDGTTRHISTRGKVVKDEDGKPIRLNGILWDITDKKIEEEKLETSERRYRDLFDNANDLIYTLDLEGNFTSYNKTAETVVGFKLDKNGKMPNMRQFLDEDEYRKANDNIFYKIQQGVSNTRYEAKLNTMFGTTIDLQVNSYLHFKDGKPYEVFGIARDITQEKINEIALKESEEKYRLLAENAVEVVWIADFEGRITYISQSCYQLAGYTAEEYYTLPLHTFFPMHVMYKIMEELENFKNAIATGNDYSATMEYEQVCKDGSLKWVELRAKIRLNEAGEIIGIQGVSVDISARKKAEIEISKNEEKYRDIFNNIQDVYFETQLTGEVLELSPSIKNASGYTRDEIIGRKITDFYQSQKQREDYIRELIAKKEINDYEIVLIDKSEKPTRCTVSTKIVFDENRNPLKIVGSMRNVEARRKAEEMQHELEKKYAELVNNASDMIFTLDFKGHFTSANPATIRILGYQSHEIKGKHFERVLAPRALDKTNDFFRQKMEGERETTTYETTVVAKDGRLVSLDVSTYLRWENNVPTEIFGIARDISERKKLEAAAIRNYDIQKAINGLLSLSLEEYTLKEIFEKALNTILSISWLSLEQKGCVFLLDHEEKMMLFASEGLSDEVLKECAEVKSGKCICGLAFSKKEIIYSPCLDHDHSVSYQGMLDHGHYCVPILYSGKVIGIINTYLATNHIQDEVEVKFLTSIANTLAGIIVRKDAEDELKRSYDLLEDRVEDRTRELAVVNENLLNAQQINLATINAINEWVYMVDTDMKFVLMNDNAVEALNKFGLNATDYKDRYLIDVLTFISAKELQEYQTVFTTGKDVFTEEKTVINGNIVITETKKIPILENEEVKYIVTTVYNITKLRQAEEDILNSLEKEKELNNLKSQFISTVSHEFRTPLAGILSGVQLLQRYGEKWELEKKVKVYKQIQDSVTHTKILLDDVSLMDAEQNTMHRFKPVEIDLLPFVNQMIDENIVISERDFKINITHSLMSEKHFLDPTMMIHIFNNVLSNAIKYSGDKDFADFKIAEDNNGNLTFIIKDYGIGIPEEDMKYLFESFHRASNVGDISGTGFGLTIVKRFVLLHHGSIDVQSELGKGTTVTIVLPGK